MVVLLFSQRVGDLVEKRETICKGTSQLQRVLIVGEAVQRAVATSVVTASEGITIKTWEKRVEERTVRGSIENF